MQSVGIMSMQRIYNYGSSLQAYALRRLIEGVAPDASVSFVDYRPGPPLVASDAEPRRRNSRVAAKIREYNDVDTRLRNKLRFFNHKRTYARDYFPLIGIPPNVNYNLGTDVQVIGSDEVFNCVQANVNVGYARDLFGHNSPARKVISYAGSFGNTTLNKIDATGIRDDLAKDLGEFAAISVRDQNSSDIVTALTGHRPAIHLDPTLVYDFSESSPTVPPERPYPGKYIVVYGYSGRFSASENEAIRVHAERIGARVLAFGGLQASADDFIDCDPFTLLAYFRDAEAVITDTFHGTIFSVISEVPFATIIRKSSGHGYGNEEKLGYLLDSLGLRERALNSGDDLTAMLMTPVDFRPVKDVRAKARAKTLTYLASSLAPQSAEEEL